MGRFFGDSPGVYVHKDGTCRKTGNYVRFVPLCRDGVFWAALWEVQVDRSDRIPVSRLGTDQWVQHERSVRLSALWLIGCTYECMSQGWEVGLFWDPKLEANPANVEYLDTSAERTLQPIDDNDDELLVPE